MSAPTVAVRRALARAGEKGLAHIAAQQNTGTWISQCGKQIRGRDIHTWDGPDAITTATNLGSDFCTDCAEQAIDHGGTLPDGIAVLLKLHGPDSSARLVDLPVTSIRANHAHPRKTAGDGIDALVDSVREHGIVQPITVRRTRAGFELVAGARRLYAARVAGLPTIPAIVRDRDLADTTIDALVENLHRADLNPIEQAHAYSHALEQLQVSKAELGRRLGISREQISNTIRLLQLPVEEQDRIAAGTLTASEGRAILAGATMQVSGLKLASSAPSAKELALLADLGAALAGLLDARVKVASAPGDRRRITIDVPETDLARILGQLGIQAAAA